MSIGLSHKTGHNASAKTAIIQDLSLKETRNLQKKSEKATWNL